MLLGGYFLEKTDNACHIPFYAMILAGCTTCYPLREQCISTSKAQNLQKKNMEKTSNSRESVSEGRVKK